ncbi:COP9 signalosome complex subunit 1, putative [Entamoeba histolytica HM-3:IMSS]|uniref:COP9 signalosome complex subunit 1, putative n=2 Tax=Entamoeba histolytica TaxID=5759 RepID=M2Q6H9_ENTHI|nr:COP9 signalosome complex subunit 1, putative [Entamoeba histolytica KU27]EMS10712.1 COP9 signalosome complex subunit 1, putative [Entamoeba histolytica HM-3:IMSS]
MMNNYIQSYCKYGRIIRYINLLSNGTIGSQELLEAIDYTELTKNIGGFARLKEAVSSTLPLDEPEWKKKIGYSLFEQVKALETEIQSTYGDEERAKLLYKLSDIHEEHGEYSKAIKNVLQAVESLKNKMMCAEGYYRLVRLNIFNENFHQATNFLNKLQSLDAFTGNLYTKFINIISFLLAIRNTETFITAFELLDKVTTFDEKDNWEFGEFLSFQDIAIYGTLIGLLTQKHQTNVIHLINNSKFRNHADTVPELVILLDDYKQNKFSKICNDVQQLEKYFQFNLYFNQSINNVINCIKRKCYIEYIFAYSVVDMNVMAKMFGDSLMTIESALEDYIYSDVIKAKIDAVTHTLNFVDGDERYHAYESALNAVTKAINLSQEIVLKSDVMFDF